MLIIKTYGGYDFPPPSRCPGNALHAKGMGGRGSRYGNIVAFSNDGPIRDRANLLPTRFRASHTLVQTFDHAEEDFCWRVFPAANVEQDVDIW